jgi:2-hydroxychromene-2-carboxylate isomerase
LFQAVWVRSLHVSEPAVIERVANELGLSGALLMQAETPAIKRLLHDQTDNAISQGVFGVPTMQIDNELFWGYDDFPYLELFLAGQDPLDSRELEKWQRSIRPSSVRKRFRSG